MIVGKINPSFYSSDKINFAEQRNRLTKATEEYSLGGIELEDTSKGLKSNTWVSYLGSDNNIFIKRIDREESSIVFEFPDIDWLSFTFDQNMRPVHSFMSRGKSYIRFYSGIQFEIKELIGARFPNIILDLYEEEEDIPKSDIVLAYVKDGKLIYTLQRTKFADEVIIATDINKSMVHKIGILVDGRFGFHWR